MVKPSAGGCNEKNIRIGTVLLVLLICMRYDSLIGSKKYADPVDVPTLDKGLIFLVLSCGVCMLVLCTATSFF